ncbi:MAG TPA: hypothetical protein VFA50_15820 [Stellaceae bacterium]|nr:hypothetical protein [Stellaceae bacterium]
MATRPHAGHGAAEGAAERLAAPRENAAGRHEKLHRRPQQKKDVLWDIYSQCPDLDDLK